MDVPIAFYALDRWDMFVMIGEKWRDVGLFRWVGKYFNFIFIDRFNPDIKAEELADSDGARAIATKLGIPLKDSYGLGKVQKVPDRIDFDPFPWESFAVWILTQMKRWGQIKGDVDYAKVAREVFLATDAAKLMKEVGLTPPSSTSKAITVMGKPFDSSKPEAYVQGFPIKRT